MTDHIDLKALRELHEGIVDIAECANPTEAGEYLVRCTVRVMKDLPALLRLAEAAVDINDRGFKLQGPTSHQRAIEWERALAPFLPETETP